MVIETPKNQESLSQTTDQDLSSLKNEIIHMLKKWIKPEKFSDKEKEFLEKDFSPANKEKFAEVFGVQNNLNKIKNAKTWTEASKMLWNDKKAIKALQTYVRMDKIVKSENNLTEIDWILWRKTLEQVKWELGLLKSEIIKNKKTQEKPKWKNESKEALQHKADIKKYWNRTAIRNNNPWNLRGWWDLWKDKTRHAKFSTLEKWYEAFVNLIKAAQNWTSRYYTPDMSLAKFRTVYTWTGKKPIEYKSRAKSILKSMWKTNKEAEAGRNTIPIKNIPTKYIVERTSRFEDHKMYQLLNDRWITEGLANPK